MELKINEKIDIPEGYENYWEDNVKLSTLFLYLYNRFEDRGSLKKLFKKNNEFLDVKELDVLCESYNSNVEQNFTFNNSYIKNSVTNLIFDFKQLMIEFIEKFKEKEDDISIPQF